MNNIKIYLGTFILLFVLSFGGENAVHASANDLLAQGKITPIAVGRILQDQGIPYQTKFDESTKRPKIIVTARQLPSEQFEIYFFELSFLFL